MAAIFTSEGKAAENLAADVYGLTLIGDVNLQYVDVDAVDENGRTISIKDQMKTSKTYGTITVEYELGTLGNERMDGNFLVNETDEYMWLVSHKGERGFMFMLSDEFKKFVLAQKEEWPVRGLTQWTIQENVRRNRKYPRAWSWAVPVDVLIQQCWCEFDPLPDDYFRKYYRT